MLLWNLELDDEFYRIYDSNKLIAGYFDPDYGNIYPEERIEEIITQMIKNHDKISGGFLILPFVKFGLFDTEGGMNFEYVKDKITRINSHLDKWGCFLSQTKNQAHSIHVSHTDQDMLSITFPIKFAEPTPLKSDKLLFVLTPTLNSLQESGLL